MKLLKALILLIVGLPVMASAQETLTLEDCYALLTKNYPLIRQKAYLAQSNQLSKEAIQKNFLPQVNLGVQATWQSDVPHVPVSVPGQEIPLPNKDQYKATININQIVYDGGSIKTMSELQELENQGQQQQVDISMHQLKTKVNYWFYSILLLQEKAALLQTVKDNLEARYKETRSAVQNGVALPSSDDILYAEILKTNQQIFEATADKTSSVKLLGALVGTTLPETVELLATSVTLAGGELTRPELSYYATQKLKFEASSKQLHQNNAPKISLYAQGGVGNPGLNVLDNTYQPFFTGGIRLSWNLWDWNMVNKQRQALLINKDIVDSQRDAFNLNTNMELIQLQTEIDKTNQLLKTDDEIIELRTRIGKTTESRLRNGAITSSTYVTELTNLNQAQISRKTHEIQLELNKANYNVSHGTSSMN